MWRPCAKMGDLPNREVLHVDERKATHYLLDLQHKDGGSKARFFLSRGFTREEWPAFAEALKVHGTTQTVTKQEMTRHGQKFSVECQIETPDGRNPCILSVWIQIADKAPALVTAHPNS